ncbi:MAG: hypothetical protein MI976_11215 [Pseudomonadales bacterium]|nr:hypothetical protein [Pseudomonadales bacterium]
MQIMDNEFDTIAKKALEVAMSLACAIDGINRQQKTTVLALGESYLYGLLHHEVINGEQHGQLVSTFQQAAIQHVDHRTRQRAHVTLYL